MQKQDVVTAIRTSGVVGIVRAATASDGERAGRDLLDAGLPVVEVSLSTPDALRIIQTLARLDNGTIGAGTVRTVEQVEAAYRAGATFIVSPVLSLSVLNAAHNAELATLPGVGSATEAAAALTAGADFLKLFPASTFGPGAVGDLLTAMPELPLVPTGGVTLEDVPAYIRAGCPAVGLGSALTTGTLSQIQHRVTTLLESIRLARPHCSSIE